MIRYIKGDITKKELEKVDGVLEVVEKADEFEVKIKEQKYVSKVFEAISKHKKITKKNISKIEKIYYFCGLNIKYKKNEQIEFYKVFIDRSFGRMSSCFLRTGK